MINMEDKFNPLNVSSKFAICGLPLRVDTFNIKVRIILLKWTYLN